MSDRGIPAVITDGASERIPCLLIGHDVPRIHHSDRVPVYLVVESDQGMPIVCKNGSTRTLLAYPSHFPAVGKYNRDHWLYANHEWLPWHALIPCFDQQEPPMTTPRNKQDG